ncbi:MAG: efflux RND transporter periplasmic adaptor subunit, partial [Phycisphaerales bacterium]|nr:efflux RND transporter periplasmic adaptor subunit [Phycisphaerales bacterium]
MTVRFILAATLLLCPIMGSCSRQPAGTPAPGAARPPETVELAPVRRMPVTQWVDVSGTLEPNERVLVAAKVAGRVAAVEHDLGDRVADGAVLARID